MAEKKLSATALKKLEVESRKSFIEKTVRVIMGGITGVVAPARMMKNAKITVDCKNRQRYFRLHYYGATLNFNVFGDGNVTMRLEETVLDEKKYENQLFAFTTDEKEQEAFLVEFESVLPLLLEDFFEDFNVFMDWLLTYKDIRKAHEVLLAERAKEKL